MVNDRTMIRNSKMKVPKILNDNHKVEEYNCINFKTRAHTSIYQYIYDCPKVNTIMSTVLSKVDTIMSLSRSTWLESCLSNHAWN